MSDPVFLVDDLGETPTLRLSGPEGRHAAVVRRIGPGERVVLADGRGSGRRCRVLSADKTGLDLEVIERLSEAQGPRRLVVVQALAKGERSELALEMMTEMGVDEVVPWQSSRSIVRWQGERGAKSLAKWRACVRAAAKQSRRLRVPEVAELIDTRRLAERLRAAQLALVLHEGAVDALAAQPLPTAGEIVLVVGPEGGISDAELAALGAAGGRPVLLGRHVLRTSTAGVVALAQLAALDGSAR